jgi:hypothetical protein
MVILHHCNSFLTVAALILVFRHAPRRPRIAPRRCGPGAITSRLELVGAPVDGGGGGQGGGHACRIRRRASVRRSSPPSEEERTC